MGTPFFRIGKLFCDMAEVDELLKKAYKVKVASEDGENTALRIGNQIGRAHV